MSIIMNRVYGHTELAILYFPGILAKSASSQLSLWINRDEDLLAKPEKNVKIETIINEAFRAMVKKAVV